MKLKLKLSERMALTYVISFLFFMIFCGFFVLYFLKIKNENNIKKSFVYKVEEVNTFLDKIDSFSNKYNSITLEFNPKVENQKITYSKPFDPGESAFAYIIRIRNSNNYDEIALSTFNKEVNKEEILKFIKDINSSISLSKINQAVPKNIQFKKNTYSTVRLNKTIGGNVFDIYILKDVTQDIVTYKTLSLLISLYTLFGLLIIGFMSKKLTKKMLKPINNIIETASSISTNDLTVRIKPSNTNDELDNLIYIINNMLERLNIAFDNQSKFISDVSHELRTPLAIIKGYAELIKRHGNEKKELIDESLELIINESNNMKNLVDKLLFLARGDANTVKINMETFDSTEFIKQVYNDAMFFSKEHNLIIEKNEKYTLFADKSLLLQAIRTIIENSVKYSNKNTNIYIKSSYDTLNKEAVITIKDEGIGIEKEHLEKIFERFYRVDESRTKNTGGTGLGLSIVKRIVSIHGGYVKVNSEIDKGSEFILHIPSKKKKDS